MNLKSKRNSTRGQTALILILLSAAALVFLAITLNWGRIAENKTQVTIAADQAAALLASDAASMGEMWKREYLNNTNRVSSFDMKTFLLVLAAIVAIVISIVSFGALSELVAVVLAVILTTLAITMAVVMLAIQLAMIEPGISKLWNNMMENQPQYQQFYEQGVGTALQSSVSDQVNIGDYFDENTNGNFGIGTNNIPNDVIPRFAFFYTERLKMLTQNGTPSQIQLFDDQLRQLMSGTTCLQNFQDSQTTDGVTNGKQSGIVINPNCIDPDTKVDFCCNLSASGANSCDYEDPDTSDPACAGPIPNTFQLNDTCGDSDPTNTATYNPYCDPCCQADPTARPASCFAEGACVDATHTTPAAYCKANAAAACCTAVPNQCTTNNFFGTNYPFLYDQTFQEYNNGKSLLDLWGRDQQQGPFNALTPEPIGPQASQGSQTPASFYFPNGLYPFFWLMKDYSPEVDNINPAVSALQPSQYHWCASSAMPPNTAYLAPANFPDLSQLSLQYTCQGEDCCVNGLADSFDSNDNPQVTSNPAGNPVNGAIDMVGKGFTVTPALNPVNDPSFAQGNGATGWMEGDDQMCLTKWPYNGANPSFPDGTCEWTGTYVSPNAASCPSPTGGSCGPYCSDGSGPCSTPQAAGDTPGCPGQATCAVQCKDGSACVLDTTVNAPTHYTYTCPNGGTYLSATGLCSCSSGTCSSSTGKCSGDNSPCLPTASKSSQATMDALDNNMHALSDFTVFADSILRYNIGFLSTSFDNWYPKAADWITPPSGRLLSIFEPGSSTQPGYPDYPQGYPNVPGFKHNYTGALIDKPRDWYNAINNWMGTPYTDPAAWCVPPQDSLKINGTDTYENTYIANNSGTGPWGDLQHVITCLDYNAGLDSNGNTASLGPVYYYAQCQAALPPSNPNSCPAFSLPAACKILNMGRSLDAQTYYALDTPNPTDANNWCNINYSNATGNPSFSKWVNDSLTLAKDEAPKFALRAQYLQDIYNRANTMQKLFLDEEQALEGFFNPCPSGDTTCTQGGPAAQLIYLAVHGLPAKSTPNSMIYGWIDNPPIGKGGCGGQGCAHLVKITAYSPGREGTQAKGFVQPQLPWVRNFSSWQLAMDYVGFIIGVNYLVPWKDDVLENRDGYTYVSVKRWDQQHSTPVTFPNQHTLWQSVFTNPKTGPGSTGTGFAPGVNDSADNPCLNGPFGWGIMGSTASALQASTPNSSGQPYITTLDTTLLSQAFMLNDEGNGATDTSVLGNSSNYLSCLAWANQMLEQGVESHACAEYVASHDAQITQPAGNLLGLASPADNKPPSKCWSLGFPILLDGSNGGGTSCLNPGCTCEAQPASSEESDYTVKFVNCPVIPKDDLTGEKNSS